MLIIRFLYGFVPHQDKCEQESGVSRCLNCHRPFLLNLFCIFLLLPGVWANAATVPYDTKYFSFGPTVFDTQYEACIDGWDDYTSFTYKKLLEAQPSWPDGNSEGDCIYTYLDTSKNEVVQVLLQNYLHEKRYCPTGFGYHSRTETCVCNDPKKCPENPKMCPRDINPMDGNPVQSATGAKVEEEIDYSDPQGLLTFTRAYYSFNRKRPSNMGRAWRHNFDNKISYIIRDGVESVLVFRYDGAFYYFQKQGGKWISDIDTTLRLVEVPDGEGGAPGFKLYLDNEEIEYYNGSQKLEKIIKKNGEELTLSYDRLYRYLIKIEDSYGRSLSLEYNSKYQITKLIDPAGGAYTYTYAVDDKKLVSVTYPDDSPDDDTDNPIRKYHYELTDSNRYILTGITDERGVRYVTWKYYDNGLALSSEHAGGYEKTTFSYGENSSTVTYADNSSRTYYFQPLLGSLRLVGVQGDPCDGCGQSKSITYDENGFVASRTDFNNNTTTYVNDNRGLESSRTEAAGTPQARTITTEWHTDYRLPTKIIRPSVAAGKFATTTISYTDLAHPKLPMQITHKGFRPDGGAVAVRSINLQYTIDGRISQLDGPRTDVSDITTFSYYPNEAGQGWNRGQLKSVTNALGHTVTYDAYDAHGNVLQMTDANGTITSYEYDVRQRLISHAVTPAQGQPRTTTYSYDDVGQLLSTTIPDGVTLNYAYDGARYLRSITDNLGNRIEYDYDLKGNRTQEITKDPGGLLTRLVDYTYDNRDRIETINAAGSLTQLVYDSVGNLTSTTDPNYNASATHNYDALDRLMQSVDALAGTTAYDYDTNDRISSVTAPNNAQTTYAYDDLGNLLLETSPDRGTRHYSYDAAGNLVGLTDARGVAVAYAYDALGRVTSIDYPGTTEDVTFTYDAAQGCTNGVGRLCRTTDESGSTVYAYDAFGNVAAQYKTELGITYSTQYVYDASDNLVRMTYPGGRIVDYNRDLIRRIAAINATVNGVQQAVLGDVSYRADNLVTSQTFGNGHTETRSYDLQGRLQHQELPVTGQADTAPPVIFAPADISTEATALLTPVALGNASANDDTDGVLEAVADNPGPFPFGSTAVTWSATDTAGNTGTATQIVNIVDTTPPQLEVPGNIELESPTRSAMTVDIGEAVASDIFGPVTVSHNAPELFPIGTTTVTWTATDAHGLQTTGQQQVTVVLPPDTVAPVVTAPAPVIMEATDLLTPVQIGQASAIDEVDGTLVPVADNTGPFPFGTTVVTWSVADAAGNLGTAIQNITIVDTTPPVLTVPEDINMESADGSPLIIDIGQASANDIFEPVTISHDAPTQFPPGTTNIIWTATDAHNLQTTLQQQVTVTTPPGTIGQVSVRPQTLDMLTNQPQTLILYAENDSGETAKRVRIDYKLPKGLQALSATTEPAAKKARADEREVKLEWRHVQPGTALVARITMQATRPGRYVLGPHKVEYNLASGRKIKGSAELATISVSGEAVIKGGEKQVYKHDDDEKHDHDVKHENHDRKEKHSSLAAFWRTVSLPKRLVDKRHIVLVAPGEEKGGYDYLQYGAMTGYTWQPIVRADIVTVLPDLLVYVADDYLDIWQKPADQQRYRYWRLARPATVSGNKSGFLKVALTATSLESRSYSYDANGNVTRIDGTGTRSYAYDALDRLVQDALIDTGEGGSTLDYGYDANGNRIIHTTDGTSELNYTYQANSNALDVVGAQDVTHDAAGNRTSDLGGNRTFEYSSAGRLFRVYEGGSLKATYTYNALGQRTRKVTASGTTIYHYDLNGQLISETHSDGRPIRDYIWRDTEPVAQIDVDGATEAVTYLHTDHLATPRLGTDAQGVVVWRWEGEAFGSTPASGSVTVNLRFPGQYYDAETQLHYNWFRYYEPETGRYVTSDPIGLDGGLNTYGYVGNNALRAIDPLGLSEIDGVFAGINITNVDITDLEITDNPFVGNPEMEDLATIWGHAKYKADVEVGFRIICAEFDDTCAGRKLIRSWYPIAGSSLRGISGNFDIEYNPITAIRGLFSLKLAARGVAYAKAASDARKEIENRLKNTHGTLNAFAKAICIATSTLPAK